MSSKNKSYSDEFKTQIVNLCNAGKTITEIVKEYELPRSNIYKWIKEFENSGSFKAKDNRTREEEQLIRLEKENKQLKMENDILKQAALIMGRKSGL